MPQKSNANKAHSFAIKTHLWTLSFARNWTRVILTFLTLYVTLPFVAPVLMYVGAEVPAKVIYTIYKPFCHQFAFRSFFLFGDQHVYPRANTGTSLTPFETYASQLSEFDDVNFDYFDVNLIMSARSFVGNEQMGYKVALCERDIMIYLALLLGGLLYVRPGIRRRLRPVPFWLYILLGLAPIGLDGFSQLLSYPPFEFWPQRETLPIFRVVTGALFGLMSAWLAFPHFDLSIQETRRKIERKLWRAGVPF